jgi:hypothetical protein
MTDNTKHQIKLVLENCVCLGRDAYGDYIDKMTEFIIMLTEEDAKLNLKTNQDDNKK